MNTRTKTLLAATMLSASLAASACVVHDRYPGYYGSGYHSTGYYSGGVRYRHHDSDRRYDRDDDHRWDRNHDGRGDHDGRWDRDDHHRGDYRR